jgi:serine protease Do
MIFFKGLPTMETRNKFINLRLIFVGLLTASAVLGGFAYSQKSATPVAQEKTGVTSASPPSRAPSPLVDFSEIAAQQGPAVVNISVAGSVKTAFSGFPGLPPMGPDDPFQEFFKRFQGPVPRGSIPTHGLGSGFVIKSDGVILTNAHVVSDADEVTVKLTDKREFKAKVVGIDKLSDVAVLKIDAKDLPTVRIGDPQHSRVGEWVVAIGSPFGFENTVTAGIVSAKSRTLPDEGYVPFLQTDVAINPGNSGGPLFNMNGEVIGINSQIYSRSGGFQGLSFAIPIDVAMKVERQLLEHGKVSRGRLGIAIQDVSSELAETFGLDKPAGALVNSVETGSPADKAGIEPGDVLTKFGDTSISRSNELPPLVSEVAPGTRVNVTLWRHGQAKEIAVTVGELKTVQAKATPAAVQKGKLGLAVRPLTADERSEAKLVSGLVVESVSDGPAERAGIQSGDVILSVNGELISSVEQLQSKLGKASKRVALLILRDNNRIFIPINLG